MPEQPLTTPKIATPEEQQIAPHFGSLGYDAVLVERLNRAIRASELWFDFLQSKNFLTGTSGFKIDTDGSAEFNQGAEFAGDIYSSTWDGDNPADLTTVDGTATAGYYFDSSAGAGQLMGTLWMGGDIEMDDGAQIRSGPSGTNRLILEHDDISNQGQILFEAPASDTDGELTMTATSVSLFPAHDAADGRPSLTLTGSASDQTFLIAQGGVGDVFKVDTDNTDPHVLLDHTLGSVDTQLRLEAGSTSRPSVAFDADQDTGVYRRGNDQLGFVTGGSLAGYFDSGQSLVLQNDLQFAATANVFIINSDGENVLTVNQDGVGFEDANTHFPAQAEVAPSNFNPGSASTWTTVTGSTTTLWTHGGTNRTVQVMVWVKANPVNTAAVQLVSVRAQTSLDGGSTWTTATASQGYVGADSGGVGGADQIHLGSMDLVAGTATGDIQFRIQVFRAGTIDNFGQIYGMARAEMVF